MNVLTDRTPNHVNLVVKAIREGSILLYPTDTVYGIGCNIFSNNVKQVFEIKKRSLDKPFSIAVGNAGVMLKYARLTKDQQQFIESHLNEPYTFIVKKKSIVPYIVTAGSNNIGIRIMNHPLMTKILRKADVPIIATSANLSGAPPPANVKDISEEIKSACDLIADFGPCVFGKPSKVIDLTTGRVVREF